MCTGMRLLDFFHHATSRQAGLEEAEVVAIRAYSSAPYKSLNNGLRDMERRARNEAHRLPVTVSALGSYPGAPPPRHGMARDVYTLLSSDPIPIAQQVQVCRSSQEKSC